MSDPSKTPPAKKPYHPPVLETYGAVRDLTRSLTGNAMNDKGNNSTTKTG